MPLHHRREVADMRSAYSHDQPTAHVHYHPGSNNEWSHREILNTLNHPSDLPPAYHPSSHEKRSPAPQNNIGYHDRPARYFDDREFQQSPASSQESCPSTVESEEDLLEELPEFDVPDLPVRACESASQVLEATPADFSELFPSRRRLFIHHDDTTIDGNMNLRLDTEVDIHGRRRDMTLFHLRLHDLKNREFSLRRYCRDSGREVCNSAQKPATHKRPGFQRSLSNALNSMRPRTDSKSSTSPSLTRQDSGYGSMHSMDFSEDRRPGSAGRDSTTQEQAPTNTIKLEFSNYAHVEVKRVGISTTRYEFEYWGVHYTWKRVSPKDKGGKQVSYQLKKVGSDAVLAKIVPVALTQRQAEEERSRGGWIPPCSMRIEDDNILHSQKDVSDVVVATGLMALVDDSIRARFHSKSEKQMLIPVPKISVDVEYIGPKRLINDMFNWKESHGSRPPTSDGESGRHRAGSTRTRA